MSQGESGSNEFQIQQGANFFVSLLITLCKIATQVVGNDVFISLVMYAYVGSESNPAALLGGSLGEHH